MNCSQNNGFKKCMLFLLVNIIFAVFLYSLWDDQNKLQTRTLRTNLKEVNDIHGTIVPFNSIAILKDEKSSQVDQTAGALSEDSDFYNNQLLAVVPALFRIQFSKEGKCLGVSKAKVKNPVVKFCNPRENDAFVFINGKLMSEDLSYCMGLAVDHIKPTEKLLTFTDCNKAVNIKLIDDKLVQISDNESQERLCFSALEKSEDSGWKPTDRPARGVRVGLIECQGTVPSIQLLEETSFIKDRAALLLPLPDTLTNSCNFTACGVNKRVPPVKLLQVDNIERCQNLTRCVTVVTKTARRPLFVIRLAHSLRNQFNTDFPMIVIDDGPSGYSTEIMDEISKFPNMKYIITDSPDLGIAKGRTMGLQMVKTKYFFLLDDDMVVTNRTNITKLVEILDTTDTSLVGGGPAGFAGFLWFDVFKGAPTLFHSRGSCKTVNQTIPGFPDCLQCDIITNTFMAKTHDAIGAGGWSEELKIVEHKDFFLRMKAEGKKVVYCPAFRVVNAHTSKGVEFVSGSKKVYNKSRYFALRTARINIMTRKLCNRWNIVHVKSTGKKPAWIDKIK